MHNWALSAKPNCINWPNGDSKARIWDRGQLPEATQKVLCRYLPSLQYDGTNACFLVLDQLHQQYGCLEIITQLFKIFNRPCYKQCHVGTFLFWQKNQTPCELVSHS